ncbi:hypothetical protein [Hydrogenobacter thermophilus]|uniref:hypothetical protein n=1 Tax=Hydrogenobacter thermophilus TaxID=940 RepID=UPI0030F6B802
MKKLILLTAILGVSFAQESLEDLRRQLEEQKRVIQELERRIKELEKAQKEEVKPEKESKPLPADRSLQLKLKYSESLRTYQPFSQKAFLPDISLIIDTSYVNRNVRDETFRKLEIPGLYHKHADGRGHGELNKERGFNFNYAELYLYAPVDPYFDLYATIPFSEEGSEVEEAYAVTRGLPFGLQFKVGKFRSSFGRLNAMHPHMWDFANLPLVYKAFLGDDGLKEKGVQINWLAPTPFYLLFGVEALQGENEQSFGTKGFTVGDISVKDTRKPNLYVGFVKTSFDIGKVSVLTGLSYADGRTRVNHLDTEEPHAFAGKTRIYGFDLTAKYFIDSYRYISLQGEYLYRDQKGTRYAYDQSNNPITSYLTKKQGGFYTQLVWRFAPRWRAGIQYNLINKNEVSGKSLTDNLYAYYGMLEFNPSEFSRIRLQIGQNRAFYYNDQRKTVNEVILQFNFAIGAHGAHPF